MRHDNNSYSCSVAWLFYLGAALLASRNLACVNDCNRHGICNNYGQCECFNGWEGSYCSTRSCPKGPNLADPIHRLITCSGRGNCVNGDCFCNVGYEGRDCNRMTCLNNCNGNGRCLTLASAASAYDGYALNRTTAYAKWDGNTFSGCICDPGWGGADCSERLCRSGVDPRQSSNPYEKVTLACKCSPSGCGGKFKLQFFGVTVKPWFSPYTWAADLAAALMSTPGATGNQPLPSVSVSTAGGGQICAAGRTISTTIHFPRSSDDLPVLSFYANTITKGSLSFETKQVLRCNCLNHGCNGTFRLSFDGEYTARLTGWQNTISQVSDALNSLGTIRSAGVSVFIPLNGTTPVCLPGGVMNHTIILSAQAGNMPLLTIASSIVDSALPSIYKTINTTGVLSLLTTDGRQNSVHLCNGIGSCDFTSGKCVCPDGWTADPEFGPCGKLNPPSSDWQGFGRCPGVVDPYILSEKEGAFLYRDMTSVSNGHTVYYSVNPNDDNYHGPSINQSLILYDQLSAVNFAPIHLSPKVFLNMSSSGSAGPLFVDQSTSRLFFVDANSLDPFIGRAPLNIYLGNASQSSIDYVWLRVNYAIFGIAVDAAPMNRKLYWSVPGTPFEQDGLIFWAYLDDPASPIAHSLTASIGQRYLVDPSGIAVNYREQRLYWLDKRLSVHKAVIRSCFLNGSGARNIYTYDKVGGHSVSVNITSGLVFDFTRNNTAFFIDSSGPGYIVGTNVDRVDIGLNVTDSNSFVYFESSNVTEIKQPRFLSVSDSGILYWADAGSNRVNFKVNDDIFTNTRGVVGRVFPPPGDAFYNLSRITHTPVGVFIDRGLGKPLWGDYLDCYGNGRCLGLSGNWICECDEGFLGNCQIRSCPSGPAWFHKPIANEMAHDVFMECSNIGTCDRTSGQCTCRPGFEGAACERMTCPYISQIDATALHSSIPCGGSGRCLSLRELAMQHQDGILYSDPVSYNALPNDADTWDADSIFGCTGDVYGYYRGNIFINNPFDYKGNNFTCPFGFNMRLTTSINQTNVHNSTYIAPAIQRVNCTGYSGYFNLSFRGQTSAAISPDATYMELKNILEAVPTIGEVRISSGDAWDSTAIVCDPVSSSHYVDITFLSALGTLPLLEANYAGLGEGGWVSVTHVSRMSKWVSDATLQECSGKGDCDRSTGVCMCWDFHASSDGFGNKGTRGDCGHCTIY